MRALEALDVAAVVAQNQFVGLMVLMKVLVGQTSGSCEEAIVSRFADHWDPYYTL